MAQRVQVVLEDDIDGTVAAETVRFSLDGTAYEIDLTAEHARKLRASFAEWVGHARKAGRAQPAVGPVAPVSTGRSPARMDRAQLEAMRDWGRARGYKVSKRGRLSQELHDAYHQTC